MKTINPIALIVIIFLFISCKKSGNDSIAHINCNGLNTDTLGTNDNGRIYMPTGFTPNSDGLNDIIRPIVMNISSLNFTIYAEDNSIVFSTNQLNQGWSPATGSNTFVKYYYKIQAITANNHNIGKCGELFRITCLPGGTVLSSFHFEDQLTQNGFTGITNDNPPTCL